MSQQPFTPSALRGAVDLSALKRPAAGAPGAAVPGQGAPGQAPLGGSQQQERLVVAGSDSTFQDVVDASMRHPVVVVVWSRRLAESGSFVEIMAGIAAVNDGRFQLVSIDVDDNPGLMRAFQVQQVPVTLGLIQGQPVPLFVGPLLPQQVQPWIDELLKLAIKQGVTGRVSASGEGPAQESDDVEAEMPPLHQAAYDAIEAGDLDGALAAYAQAVTENPADAEAKAGIAQVRLMKRTDGVDPVAAQVAAAAAPADVDAQLLVADLDILLGHIEDAFARLIRTVRVTEGEDRNRARQRLLELFEIVGGSDERVGRARKALTSALF